MIGGVVEHLRTERSHVVWPGQRHATVAWVLLRDGVLDGLRDLGVLREVLDANDFLGVDDEVAVTADVLRDGDEVEAGLGILLIGVRSRSTQEERVLEHEHAAVCVADPAEEDLVAGHVDRLDAVVGDRVGEVGSGAAGSTATQAEDREEHDGGERDETCEEQEHARRAANGQFGGTGGLGGVAHGAATIPTRSGAAVAPDNPVGNVRGVVGVDLYGMAPVVTGLSPAIAAHRGWHQDGAPKNSIPALEQAAVNGVDAVEIDVRRLGDGTLVVYHDAALPDGRKLADVDQAVLLGHRDIPTLDAWAKRAGELKVNGLIELKESGYEDDVVRTLRRHMTDGQLEFFSFKSAAVRALSRIVPDRPVGLLSDLQEPAKTGAQLVADARKANANFLGLNVRQSGDDVLFHASRDHLGVKVWTVDLPEDLTRLLDDHRVSTVITDRPALAKEIREHVGQTMATRGLAHGTFQAENLGARLLRAVATIR